MSLKRSAWVCIAWLAVFSLVLAACAPSAQPTAEPPTALPEQPTAPPEQPTAPPQSAGAQRLVMLDWAGYEIPEFWGEFKKNHPQVQVDFSFLTESAEVFSKLQSGFEADLVHPCSNFWKILVDNNMVQPIDTSKLKNWPNVSPSLAKQGEFNGQQYWVPWDWGYESVLVRKDLVEKVPESWADIWDPQYKGHIAINDSGEAAHVWASLALGLDPWDQTPEQYEQVRQKLLELAPSVLAYWTGQTDLDQMLASGDAWLGVGAWNASYVSLLNENYDVVYIDPKEGRTGYLCGFGIPSTSKNVDLALEMIDAYLAPDAQAYLANEYGYGIANQAALSLVKPDIVKLLSLDDQDMLARTIFYKYITDEQRQLWANTWSEVKTSR
ncbi:MAG: extracellular solute-binding protein [Anaerolineales bacterium]|nr:extracellular solute-binding protein [Anaerolineales bacterium]